MAQPAPPALAAPSALMPAEQTRTRPPNPSAARDLDHAAHSNRLGSARDRSRLAVRSTPARSSPLAQSRFLTGHLKPLRRSSFSSTPEERRAPARKLDYR